MAVAGAWWWPSHTETPIELPTLHSIDSASTAQDLLPHESWPESHTIKGISFKNLEKYISNDTSTSCDVRKLVYKSGTSSGEPRWQLDQVRNTAKTTAELVQMLTQNDPDEVNSKFYIVCRNSGKSVQALGHYLDISPRFFNYPDQPISTGTTVGNYAFLHLQIMDRYQTDQVLPLEMGRTINAPQARFRTRDGFAPHQWCSTRVAVIFMRDTSQNKFRGLFMVDPADQAIADGMQILITRDEELGPGDTERCAGQGRIVCEMFYVVNLTWKAFLEEAETSLQVLSDKCVEENISFDDQLKFTRELHRLQPLWVQVRRRIIAARDAADQMIQHPYFTTTRNHEAFESYLRKTKLIFEDQIDRSQKLVSQTNVVISLIFNIATMHEAKAANGFAASIRRITWMTFVYLPLTLSASIFGMNIRQITSDDEQPHVRWYFVVAMGLMTATLTVWLTWRWIGQARGPGRTRRSLAGQTPGWESRGLEGKSAV